MEAVKLDLYGLKFTSCTNPGSPRRSCPGSDAIPSRGFMRDFLPPSENWVRWLLLLAALSFATTLFLPYVGEEAVYTLTSQEMAASRDYFVTTLYGGIYGRPPLLNWLMIPLAELLGWERVLLASRLLAAASTLASALILAWLARRLTRNRNFAMLAALVYLTSDALLYRGWLAYSDPLFSCLVFGAIASAWIGVRERRPGLLALAVLAVSAGALAKVQTAYLFYGVALLALLADREQRRFLLGRSSLALHGAAVAGFLAWHGALSHGTQAATTLFDIGYKFRTADGAAYLAQLGTFPLETLARFLPASAVALYFLLRRRCRPDTAAFPAAPLRAMLLINYLPYWLAPQSHIRYVMPLYPLFALFIAHLLWQAGKPALRAATYWMAATVALKFALGLWAFPAYQERFRGDYAATARDIVGRTAGFPLYATDVSASGLSVAAHVNTLRRPAPPLRFPPERWESGFVLAYAENPALGQVAHRYALGANDLYLLCRGAACRPTAPAAPGNPDQAGD